MSVCNLRILEFEFRGLLGVGRGAVCTLRAILVQNTTCVYSLHIFVLFFIDICSLFHPQIRVVQRFLLLCSKVKPYQL